MGAELAAADRVAALLAGSAPLGIAYSGGGDSATLLALAARALGRDPVLAVPGVSPSLAAGERAAAHDVAAGIGVGWSRWSLARRLGGVSAQCRRSLLPLQGGAVHPDLRRGRGPPRPGAVADRENADDAGRPDRPGARAPPSLTASCGRSPTRASTRRWSGASPGPCAVKPAAPCLASRIPHFEGRPREA